MKRLLLVLMLWPAIAMADGSGSAGSGSGSGSGSAAGAGSGSAAGAGSGSAAAMPVASTLDEGKPDAKDLRKTCAAAMNADPTFSADIVKAADKIAAEKRDADTLAQHQAAADQVAMNQKHVILAYGAMWFIAAVFVMFLWRRQVALRTEITSLRAELARATSLEPGSSSHTSAGEADKK